MGVSLPVGRFSNMSVELQRPYDVSLLELQRLMGAVERTLQDGSWTTANFSQLDWRVMPDLVQMANDKKTGLNLSYLTPLDGLVDLIREKQGHGVDAFRVLVNMGRENPHYGVLDCRVLDWGTSVVLFEPTNFGARCVPAIRLANEIGRLLERDVDIELVKVELDLQKSPSGCGMFSLALAKKLHAAREALTSLHEKVGNASYPPGGRFVRSLTDAILPSSFYKHMQGSARVNEYFEANPDAGERVVNKKGQTLAQRLSASLEDVQARKVSKSICNKRMYELNALMERLLREQETVVAGSDATLAE